MDDHAKRDVWILACGDDGRHKEVARRFRELEISAIGPGVPRDEVDSNDEISPRSRKPVKNFASDDAEERDYRYNDIVLLRSGVREVIGVGVLGSYKYMEAMGISGWDLYHVRSTRWLCKEKTVEWLKDVEVNGQFAIGNPFYMLDRDGPNGELCKQANEVVNRLSLAAPADDKSPTKPPILELDQFLGKVGLSGRAKSLSNGSRSDQLRAVIEAASRFSTEESYNRAEADTIAMIVVPLLRALGVSDTDIRVEIPLKAFGVTDVDSAKRVDVAVIDGSIKKPKLLIEAKRRWAGLDYAGDQGGNYRKKIQEVCEGEETHLPLVLTDGAEFEIIGLRPDGPDYSQYMSLRWLDDAGAQSLAELANYLST